MIHKFIKRNFPLSKKFNFSFSSDGKIIYLGENSKKKLLEGLNSICKTAQLTLGPKV